MLLTKDDYFTAFALSFVILSSLACWVCGFLGTRNKVIFYQKMLFCKNRVLQKNHFY